MNNVPVVSQFTPAPNRSSVLKMERLADILKERHQEFTIPPVFRELVPETLENCPSLHLDDLSELVQSGRDISFFQDRARLRAGDGDVVLTCGPHVAEYEAYCTEWLQLGRPEWLHPESSRSHLRIAERAWEDRRVRRSLVRSMRQNGLAQLHPHMGSLAVWELALLLSESSRRPMKVIASLPELTRWCNDKVAFSDAVSRLFGDSLVPESESAWNESTLVGKLQAMSKHCERIGVKLPNSAGGDGNTVFEASEVRGKSATAIRDLLRARLAQRRNHSSPLLIDSWATDVLCSPSVQTWIPPQRDGQPIVEGVFVQQITGRNGMFVGHQPAQFPHALTEDIVNRSWLIAALFQRLGYVGRCSFDLILAGRALGNCHIEFIECNGRWGGTSLPMTLMNRLFGDWCRQPYSAQVIQIPRLEQASFKQVLDVLENDLFDARTGRGTLLLYNPRRLQHGGIDVIALGDSWTTAAQTLSDDVPSKLKQDLIGRQHSRAIHSP